MKKMLTYLSLLLLVVACSKEEQVIAPLSSELRAVGKLELIEYRTEEIFVISSNEQNLKPIMTLEEISNYLNNLLTIGDRVGIYSFENFSVAYIDLAQFSDEDITLNPSRQSIHLHLPAIQVEPIGRSGKVRKLHERVTGMEQNITSEERRLMQNKASDLAIKALAPGTQKHQDLVAQAEQKARAYFTGMLHSRGYSEVVISFKS